MPEHGPHAIAAETTKVLVELNRFAGSFSARFGLGRLQGFLTG